jgi:putative DNA methylase
MTGKEKSFIEVQFPVSRLSKETYRERMSVGGQTLTGLGKWWGRKPLILVRATVLGLLLPATSDPKGDAKLFMHLMLMDELGLLRRKNRRIPDAVLYENASSSERASFTRTSQVLRCTLDRNARTGLETKVFHRLPYDNKLEYCCRAEEMDDASAIDWVYVNERLGTAAYSLQELVVEIGTLRFGRAPQVTDCFCGGGSVPFESARIGCRTEASDLNPVAGLLTWSALNLLGASEERQKELKAFQNSVFNLVHKQVDAWGIERNTQGWTGLYYLYATTMVCPEHNCGWTFPLLPSLVVTKKGNVIARLVADPTAKTFTPEILERVTSKEFETAESTRIAVDGEIRCPHCHARLNVGAIRGDSHDDKGNPISGLRQWERADLEPRSDDTFGEQLYCIVYEETMDVDGKPVKVRHYVAPDKDDLEREKHVGEILCRDLAGWHKKGYIPDAVIEPGDETSRLVRERGWHYWHQLFTPRQLLLNGLISETVDKLAQSTEERAIGLLGLHRCCDNNSKLTMWRRDLGYVDHVFYNQALNTLLDFGSRGSAGLEDSFKTVALTPVKLVPGIVTLGDARSVDTISDYFITDPPYADAVNYHELSEFFLAWDETQLQKTFPSWYADSKRALAVKGKDDSFQQAMVDIYRNLADHMSPNGRQVVYFTHRDPEVWADLIRILWASGLSVISAWNIATETTTAGVREGGNYVRGTVVMALERRSRNDMGFQDDIRHDVQKRVAEQIRFMQSIDDGEEPNFQDQDYVLASYAACAQTLTKYSTIEGFDMASDMARVRRRSEHTPLGEFIRGTVEDASGLLIPKDIDKTTWRKITKEERFYIKGLELQRHGVASVGAYQELARGLGVKDYSGFLENSRANEARLMTPTEWKLKNVENSFGLLRKVFAAIFIGHREDDPNKGRFYLKSKVEDYADQYHVLLSLCTYLAGLQSELAETGWKNDAVQAGRLLNSLKADSL